MAIKGDAMQIITKDKKVVCITEIDYPARIVKDMKSAGYKVKQVGGDCK